MGIPIVYRKSGEQAIATYNYVDVAEGAGYVVYYGYQLKTSGAAVTYGLRTTPIYSNDIEISGASTSSWAKLWDLDFDITFNQPQTVDGKVLFNIPIHAYSGGSPQMSVYAYVRKWDGTTETDIVSEQSNKQVAGGFPKILSFSADAPQTIFKAGETLRVTLEVWGNSNPASTHVLAFDPKERNGTNMTVGTNIGTTAFTVHVPFKLDL